ncbi:MAG: hypothetical protein UY48_C0002G0001, partial [Candidatus Gottesmanbacteria bacterium GW2011_GWB1_49_7]
AAETRLRDTVAAGFLPTAMRWRDPRHPDDDPAWRRLQRAWFRPAISSLMAKRLREDTELREAIHA